jgi:Ankyrin repeats (3 copies)
MALIKKDALAVFVAILLGLGFEYFSGLAGYGGILVGGFYGIVIIPLVVLYFADKRKILVWQACIVPYALAVVVENVRLGGMGRGTIFEVFLLFWVAGTVISSPVPIFLYWRRSKDKAWHEVKWLLLGLVLVGLISSLWRDPFLFFGLALVWIAVCLTGFLLAWRRRAQPNVSKASVIAAFALVFTILTAGPTGFFLKQQAFRSAIVLDHFRLARLFVAVGADPNGRDSFGETALAVAAWSGVGDLAAVNALIAMRANVNEERPEAFNGMLPSGTALHVAASAGRMEICNSLLQAGADVNARNHQGATPLLVGLSHASIACVPSLLEHGADVNAADNRGRTALMLLMNFGPADPAVQNILHELLDKGADTSRRDFEGKSAEDWAEYYRHQQFIAQLESRRNDK